MVSWTLNESAWYETCYQIDMWLFCNPGMDPETQPLVLSRSSIMNTIIWTCWYKTSPDAFKYYYLGHGRTPNRIIGWVTALAVSRSTNWCLCSCCVPNNAILDVLPSMRLNLDPLSPGWGGSVSMMAWCGTGEEDDNEKKWEALSTILVASCQNGIISNQHDPSTQDESYWVWLHVAGVSHCPPICNRSVRCYLSVNKDEWKCTKAENAGSPDIYGILFEWKDVQWCFSQMIPRILH